MDQASGLRNIMKSGGLTRKKKSLPNSGEKHTPRVIAVTSGKGGVGKTNLVGNLSIALAGRGKQVVIVDADVGLANIDIIFNLRAKYNISHIINGEKTLDDVLVTTKHGVKIIPGGSGFANLTSLSDGEKLNLLTEFESLEQMADIVLLDTGAGISSNVLYFNSAADECIVLATREPTSITDAYALMKVMSREYGTKYFKLLVNMVSSDKDAKSVYASLSGAMDKFLKDVVLEYCGYIPSDPVLQKAVLNRSTVFDYAPESPSCKAFGEIAERLIKSPARSVSDGNIKFFMNRVLNSMN